MQLETINEFVVLAKHKSFAKAAAELYISQPGLSTHISKLEKELGFLLIDRAGRKVKLTPAGKVFLDYAQKLLHTYNEGYEKRKALSRRIPPLRLASIPIDSENYTILTRAKNLSVQYVDLNFILDDSGSLAGLSLVDLGNNIHICGEQMLNRCFSHRDDIVIVDRVDGELLQYPVGIVWRKDHTCKQIESLIEVLQPERSCLA